jgi:selenocysteine lyase/cysteine desulfurase
VADAVRHYMCNNYVQLGAGYPHSDRADATVHRAHQIVKTFAGVVPCSVPGGTGGEVILGEFIYYILVRELRLSPVFMSHRFVVHAVARDAGLVLRRAPLRR